jgi:DNA-binding Lrp family transcriptional regulator
MCGQCAILAPDRVGIGIQAYVMLTMKSHDPDASAAFRARLMALDEVMEAHALTGAPDMILKVATRDLDSFNRLHPPCAGRARGGDGAFLHHPQRGEKHHQPAAARRSGLIICPSACSG